MDKDKLKFFKSVENKLCGDKKFLIISGASSSGKSFISHEIRTPINAVLGMDNMILRESNEDGIKSYAMDIKNAGTTLLSLINDLLDFSKMESGNLEVLPTEYSISSVLHDIINMTEPRVKAKNLELKCVIDENIPSRLYGDDVRIKQIIINILKGNLIVQLIKGESFWLNIIGSITSFSIQNYNIFVKNFTRIHSTNFDCPCHCTICRHICFCNHLSI